VFLCNGQKIGAGTQKISGQILLRLLPFAVVCVVILLTARFLHHHRIFAAIMREVMEAAALTPTISAVNFFGFAGILAFIVLCFIIRELNSILEIAISGASREEASLYEACLVAFCIMALGMILLFSIKLCQLASRDSHE
jgi:hypothetical protein